jgi:hypothetical protein
MVRIQLSTGYLDVKEGTSFPLNFSVGDIRDVSKRTGSFSKTITLVGNSNNNNLLNHYYDVNIQAGTFNINTLTLCDVIQNGIPVMTNASLQLINIKKTQVTGAYEQMVEYEVLVKEGRGDFFTNIANAYLTDLDFSDLDHYVDAAIVINSFNNTIADGYKYVMPFNINTTYQLNWFKPAIYAKLYFDRIFAAGGFTYTWAGLEDAFFDKAIIPYNGDQNIVDWNDVYVEAEISGFSYTKSYAPSMQQSSFFNFVVEPWTDILDPAGLFSNASYSTPQWVGIGSGESYVWEVTITGTVQLENIAPDNLHLNGGFKKAYVPYFDIRVNSFHNIRCQSSSGLILEYTQASPFPANSFSSTYSFTEVFTLNATSNGSGGIDVGDIQTIFGGVSIHAINLDGTIQFGGTQNATWLTNTFGASTGAPEIIVNISSANLTIRPSDNIPLNSGIATMNTFIPEKIKQSEFIKSIFLMYNLYATEDPDNQNNLILITRDEYYDAGDAVDWTNKLMKDKDQSLIFIPELNKKKLRLSHKADTDSPNTVYTSVTNEIYGQAEITFDNEYVKGIDVKETIFSPTPVQPTVFGAFLPLLNGAAPKTNIRILLDNGELTAQDVNILSGYDTVTATGGKYPYLSHFGGPDAFNPIFDINFAICDYYYYQVSQNTDSNLYNLYWRRTISQINNGKILSAYFYLRESDIQAMKLNDKIRIDNSWWNINKIIDYNANDLQPTKVELISVDKEIDLPRFFFKAGRPVGPGNGSQINSIMQQYNNSTNVTTNNNNSIILGSGNVIGDRVTALVVGDGLTVENNGIATTNLTVTGTLNNRSVSDILPTYTKYIALISQVGTADPTVIELENTIGPIIWTRTGVGIYIGTLTGAYTLNKTYTTITSVTTVPSTTTIIRTTDDVVTVTTYVSTAFSDSNLNTTTLEIRVYE